MKLEEAQQAGVNAFDKLRGKMFGFSLGRKHWPLPYYIGQLKQSIAGATYLKLAIVTVAPRNTSRVSLNRVLSSF